jgi:hypothetical protein
MRCNENDGKQKPRYPNPLIALFHVPPTSKKAFNGTL